MKTLARLEGWMRGRGFLPFAFQREAWRAYLAGESGLIQVATGSGKTYAAYFGPLARMVDEAEGKGAGSVERLRLLYVSPLRAVTRDIEAALRLPVEELGLPVTVESRTGDTSAAVRARQKSRLPNVLLTTPESLALLLSQRAAGELFGGLGGVILDEWHELLGSKRGSQTDLLLARLRAIAPQVQTWALSATIANLDEAAQCAVGAGRAYRIVRAKMPRKLSIETLLPEAVDAFPWAGHFGLTMRDGLARWLDPAIATLVFTNTRAQAELWYQGLLTARREWEGVLALHHGSLEREERERVEAGLKSGAIRIVVATSSLDLGVDFGPVERVVQIGSPKGVARLVQRAGRSGHRPGAESRVLCVPTHALELVEIAAARDGAMAGEVEPRRPFKHPLDVLAQHMVSCACAGGFTRAGLLGEVRAAATYRELTADEFEWALDLVRFGGAALRAYPNFRKVVEDEEGRFVVADERVARTHRLNIGTIVAESSVTVRYRNGATLGQIEEYYVSKLRPGDTFVFAGQVVRFEQLRDLTAWVRKASGKTTQTPHWAGARMPFSTRLSQAVRERLDAAARGQFRGEEMGAAKPVLKVQARLSAIPRLGELLIELCETEEGEHVFVYPFEGRLVHEGIAALTALRLSRVKAATFSLSVNDYGFEVVAPRGYGVARWVTPELFSSEQLVADVVEGLNVSELAKRQFREVARVAGLVFPGYPGARKTSRQVQMSTGLLYDVFVKYDPRNLLVDQARREVMERQFEESRLRLTLQRMREAIWVVKTPARPTPLGFPLLADRLGSRLVGESVVERVERLKAQWGDVT